MKNKEARMATPEQLRYTKYYEHNGLLRAYANRAWLATVIFGLIALGSFAFAVYVRLQPPTVIRIDSEGTATVVGGGRTASARFPSLSLHKRLRKRLPRTSKAKQSCVIFSSTIWSIRRIPWTTISRRRST